jgi:hypothetical protein
MPFLTLEVNKIRVSRKKLLIGAACAGGLVLILNPRVALSEKTRLPIYLVSCSTGMSLHWGAQRRVGGLMGLYTKESAGAALSSNSSSGILSSADLSNIAEQVIMSPCISG